MSTIAKVTKAVMGELDDRFHLTPVIEKNLTRKQVPCTLSWAGCFGGLAFLIFLIQIFTGILLLLSPT